MSRALTRGYHLSAATVQRVKEIGTVNTWEMAAWVATYLSTILIPPIFVGLWGAIPTPLYFLLIVFIARQQRGLELMVHDASHFNFSKKLRWLNDVLGTFVAAPMAQQLWRYRRSHLLHHNSFGSPQDPCLHRFSELQVDALMRARGVHRFSIMLGETPNYFRKYYLAIGSDWVTISCFITWHFVFYVLPITLLAGSVVLALKIWLAFWAVPMLLLLPILRMIAETEEHLYHKDGTEFGSTINNLGWIHRALIHPWRDGYHLVHHLFPMVPQPRHPKIHAFLIENDPAYAASLVRLTPLSDVRRLIPTTCQKKSLE